MPSAQAVNAHDVHITAGPVTLDGRLEIPSGAQAIVMFVHGSGSSRFSPRNRHVAQLLRNGGLATLLFDLLTPGEEQVDAHSLAYRFDISLLANRLLGATDWLAQYDDTGSLRVGYFGASTGAAAALVAAARRPERVGAVVSRGGRPDLAKAALAHVHAPTLLIVGERDTTVWDLNNAALVQLPCEKHLEVVPHATHLFEESGTLDEVARLARAWFERYLIGQQHAQGG